MPKLSSTAVPSYRVHKQSGQAIVTLCGKDHLLGTHGSAASREKYDRLIAEWIAGGRQSIGHAAEPTPVSEVIAAYWEHADKYYRHPDGTPTGESDSIRKALGPLRQLYGSTAASAFGPLALKAVREEMVRKGWCRTYVNSQIGRTRRMFKWAAENELVPPSVFHGLAAVSGLKVGRTEAPEAKPIRPVAEDRVEAVLPQLSRQVAAMVRLQLLTGMRPGEVCKMRGIDLDMTGAPWLYCPAGHKTAHHGHHRTIYFGPQAQEVLKPFLKTDVEAHLFSPADAVAEHNAARHAKRKTPMSCGNRPDIRRRSKHLQRMGFRYTVGTYDQAIMRACDRAFPPPESILDDTVKLAAWREEHRWHPNQLRHTAATKLRRNYGLEAAQVILGHRTLTVTQVYAEKNVDLARQVVGEAG
jgi:integrase